MNKNLVRRYGRKASLIILAGMASASVPAFALGTIAELWATINFLDVIAAIFGIGALVIGVDLAQLGYQKVRRLVKGAH